MTLERETGFFIYRPVTVHIRDGEFTISHYEVYVFCTECSDVHLAELRIELQRPGRLAKQRQLLF